MKEGAVETRPNRIRQLLEEPEKPKTAYDKFEAWAESRDIDHVTGFLVLTGTVVIVAGLIGYYEGWHGTHPTSFEVVVGQVLFWITLIAFVAGCFVLVLVLNERDAQRRHKDRRKDQEIADLKRKLEECNARHTKEPDDLTRPARGANQRGMQRL